MDYNKQYLDVKVALIDAFMINSKKNILDVSYRWVDKNIYIQVVQVDGSIMPDDVKNKIRNSLAEYAIQFSELYISKDQFNESSGSWTPKYYTWLDNLLFSKAEIT